MQDERLERDLGGAPYLGAGEGGVRPVRGERRLAGSGRGQRAVGRRGEPSLQGKQHGVPPWSLLEASATVVAVSTFYCQEGYSVSLIYIHSLWFFAL